MVEAMTEADLLQRLDRPLPALTAGATAVDESGRDVVHRVSAFQEVELLLELHAAGSTIIVVTHDRDLADRFPRRISMRDGRVDERAV